LLGLKRYKVIIYEESNTREVFIADWWRTSTSEHKPKPQCVNCEC